MRVTGWLNGAVATGATASGMVPFGGSNLNAVESDGDESCEIAALDATSSAQAKKREYISISPLADIRPTSPR